MSPHRLLSARGDGAVWPFAGAMLLALVTLPLPPTTVNRPAAIGAAAVAVVMLAPLAMDDRRTTWRRRATLTAPWLGFLFTVLMRVAEGGVTSKYAPLALLSVLWMALYGTRRQLLACVAGLAAVFVVPALLLGPPDYPSGEYGRALIHVVVALLGGFMVQRLVADVQHRSEDIATLAEVAHAMSSADEVDQAVCDAACRIARADVAVLIPVEEEARVVSAHRTAGVSSTLPRHAERTLRLYQPVLAGDDAEFVSDARLSSGLHREVADLMGASSVFLQPVRSADRHLALLAVGWRDSRPPPGARLRAALEVLASDAAGSLERTLATRQLERQAATDPLTGALNRRAWDAALEREVHRAQRTNVPLCVAVIDLDNFKVYNDTHGHAAGDDLLRRFATAARQELRDVDVFARWGGEEFAVLLQSRPPQESQLALERLRSLVPAGQTCSVGATWVRPDDDPTDPLRRADAALYVAKQQGRDRLIVA